jgi:hypothetical protein
MLDSLTQTTNDTLHTQTSVAVADKCRILEHWETIIAQRMLKYDATMTGIQVLASYPDYPARAEQIRVPTSTSA